MTPEPVKVRLSGAAALVLVALGLAAAMQLAPLQRAAADTQLASVALTAQVDASCTINAAAQLTFPIYDVSSGIGSAATGAFSIACSMGAPVYITLGQGTFAATGSTDGAPLRQMSAGGSDRLAYALYRDAARTQSWGNTQATSVALVGNAAANSVMLYGEISAGQSVASGTYSDNVLATVTF